MTRERRQTTDSVPVVTTRMHPPSPRRIGQRAVWEQKTKLRTLSFACLHSPVFRSPFCLDRRTSRFGIGPPVLRPKSSRCTGVENDDTASNREADRISGLSRLGIPRFDRRWAGRSTGRDRGALRHWRTAHGFGRYEGQCRRDRSLPPAREDARNPSG